MTLNEFKADQKILDSIDGFFTEEHHLLFENLLSFQEKNNIKGDIGEIGVFKGRSATLLAKHVGVYSLYLIDIHMDNDKAEILKNIHLLASPEYIQCYSIDSKNFLSLEDSKFFYNKSRFIHIDGGHTGNDIYSDLKVFKQMLSPEGIIAVDDFYNDEYPQVTESIYKYINNNPYDYVLFLTAFNKAYLCRPEMYSVYYNFCFNDILSFANNFGYKYTLHKSSCIGDSFTIGITKKINNFDYIGPDKDSWKYIDTVKKITIN